MCLGYFDNTSESGGVLGRVGAGVGEAADCCDSGCGVDNGSVLERMREEHGRFAVILKNESDK